MSIKTIEWKDVHEKKAFNIKIFGSYHSSTFSQHMTAQEYHTLLSMLCAMQANVHDAKNKGPYFQIEEK